jgi:hypothetical protein
VWIRGNEPFPGGSVGNLYTDGAVTNIIDFHQAIMEGKCENQTVAPSVRSNLTAVLGREAGYKGGEVTLSDLVKKNEKLEPDLRGAKS